MSQNNPSILYVGLDVSKFSLDLHLAGKFENLSNDPRGHAKLLKLLKPYPHAHLICEATGGYEQAAVRTLQAANIPVSILEASRVRYFARAQGLRAKTDRIDAAVLTEYGHTFQPAPIAAPTRQQQQLAELSQRRRQLVEMKVLERNHLEHYADTFRRRQARSSSVPWKNKLPPVSKPSKPSSIRTLNWPIKPSDSKPFLEWAPSSPPPCWQKCPN
jgi:transposase